MRHYTRGDVDMGAGVFVGLAEVVLGLGFWAFFALIFVLAWASSTFDIDAMWRRVEEIR